MCRTACPWGMAWPFPALSLIDIRQVRQLHPAPHQWKELRPVENKSRNDLATFVFVFSYLRFPLKREPKNTSLPPTLPVCSFAVNVLGLSLISHPAAQRLRNAWHAGPGLGACSRLVPGEAGDLGCFFQEQLQQCAAFGGLTVLRHEQEVLSALSPPRPGDGVSISAVTTVTLRSSQL